MIDKFNLPKHIAIIMDGNGRWAERKGLPKITGHRMGVESVRTAVEYCREIGIPILTVYAFSTENWKRPEKEVDVLMGFVGEYIDKEIDNFKNNEIRLNCIGDLKGLPDSVREKVEWAMAETKNYSRLIFNVALNYGSRAEIVSAVNRIVNEGMRDIDEERFGDFLYTGGLPDPDLLIRTSGEMRISNFMLWQISYAELYFTERLWPDFKKRDLEEAIEAYQKRKRRFGGL